MKDDLLIRQVVNGSGLVSVLEAGGAGHALLCLLRDTGLAESSAVDKLTAEANELAFIVTS